MWMVLAVTGAPMPVQAYNKSKFMRAKNHRRITREDALGLTKAMQVQHASASIDHHGHAAIFGIANMSNDFATVDGVHREEALSEGHNLCAKCKQQSTRWNNAGARRRGNGKTYYLDRHNVNCGTSRVMNQWRLRRRGDNVKIEYECCEVPGGVVKQNAKIASTHGGDETSLDGLVRLGAVACGDGAIQRWAVRRRKSSRSVTIQYWCAKPRVGRTTGCHTIHGRGNDDGPDHGRVVYLDRQKVQCRRGTYLSKWDIWRTDRRRKAHIKMVYTCCGMYTPAPPPTRAPTFIFPSQKACAECRLQFNNLEQNPFTTSEEFTTHKQMLTLKFTNVCTVDQDVFDLKMDISPGLRAIPARSEVVGNMYKLNMAVGSSATIKFTLLQGETIANPAKVESVLFSVLDLDKGDVATHQWMTGSGISNGTCGSEVVVNRSASGVWKFTATRQGDSEDNPHNSMDLKKEVLKSSVALQYSSTAEWTMTFGINGGDPRGRFFFLAGATSLQETFCPPTTIPDLRVSLVP